jgi:hypothetical protein
VNVPSLAAVAYVFVPLLPAATRARACGNRSGRGLGSVLELRAGLWPPLARACAPVATHCTPPCVFCGRTCCRQHGRTYSGTSEARCCCPAWRALAWCSCASSLVLPCCTPWATPPWASKVLSIVSRAYPARLCFAAGRLTAVVLAARSRLCAGGIEPPCTAEYTIGHVTPP